MRENELLSAVDACYEAAVTAEGWTDALDRLALAAGATCAMFLAKDRGPPAHEPPPSLNYKGLLEEYISGGWVEGHYRVTRGWPLAAKQQVVLEHHLATDKERRRSPQYNELYLKWKLPWFAAVAFAVEGHQWCMPMLRSADQGFFTPDDATHLAALAPHLRQMIRLSESAARARAAAGLDVLESIGKPALLLDRQHRVVRFNIPCAKILSSSSGDLSIRQGRLTAAHRDSDRRLHDLIAVATGPGGPSSQGGAHPVMIERNGRRPLVAEAVALSTFMAMVSPETSALILLTDLEDSWRAPVECIGSAFRLTPAEGKLAGMIALGERVEDCAERLGIGLGTARQRLKAILAKTDTHRQAELVALLRGVMH
jgi:DNA-binding CsgD family transcriptional regulator